MPDSLDLSDFGIVSATAALLPPERRQAFLEAVDKALAPSAVIGPGLVYRVVRDLQKDFVDPVRMPPPGGKYSRVPQHRGPLRDGA